MKIHVRVNQVREIGTCHWEAMVPSRQMNKHCQAIRVNKGLEYHPDFPIFWLKNKNVKFAIFFLRKYIVKLKRNLRYVNKKGLLMIF